MIRLPYPPSNNRYFRNFRGRMVTSPEGRAYQKVAALACKAAGVILLQGDIDVQVIFHPRMTKAGKASGIRLDLDNIFKPVFDSLNGIAYADDRQIVKIIAEIGVPVQDGGVSVMVNSAGVVAQGRQ